MGKHHSPNTMVGTLLPKAGTNRSTLFLDNGSFVRYRLGRAHIANELFHYSNGYTLETDTQQRGVASEAVVVRELIVGDFGGDDPAIGPPWLS